MVVLSKILYFCSLFPILICFWLLLNGQFSTLFTLTNHWIDTFEKGKTISCFLCKTSQTRHLPLLKQSFVKFKGLFDFCFFGLCVWKMFFMRLVLASSLKRVISKNVKCMFFCFPLKWVLLSIFVFCFHTWEDMHNGVTLRESFRETML